MFLLTVPCKRPLAYCKSRFYNQNLVIVVNRNCIQVVIKLLRLEIFAKQKAREKASAIYNKWPSSVYLFLKFYWQIITLRVMNDMDKF